MAKYKKQKHNSQAEHPSKTIAHMPQSNELTTCAPNQMTFRLAACDTWFFRESRPHDAVGASELASLFPPSIRTLAGALRTYFGEQIGIDWQTLSCVIPGFDFQSALGGPDDLGQLQLNGPWIMLDGKRLYTAPLYLMHGSKEGQPDLQRLQPGQSVHCDLGDVRLPQLPIGIKGYKTLEQRWLTAEGMAQCLNGHTPVLDEIIAPEQLFSHEARLGIARDNTHRKVLEGKLYQTRHIRIQDTVTIELEAQGLDSQLIEQLDKHDQPNLLRLGGEGRMASLERCSSREALPFAKSKTAETVLLHFLTPADFNGQWYPDGFQCIEHNGLTLWQGQLNGIELSIEAAVIGKVHREGGWDMQNHRPRPVKSYLPAGSAWFCRLPHPLDWQILTEKLHGQCIGNDTALGRGQILLGHWLDSTKL